MCEVALAFEQLAAHYRVRVYTPAAAAHQSSQGLKIAVRGDYAALASADSVAVISNGVNTRRANARR
ncbi:hypothetical protein F0169_26700 [Pseudomonas sp. MAFF 212408]|uniref:Uncharacterized protein n=1 Tax=Pseudomonas kitaguniensis TaxID=2607908 RepID=A0A5N7KT41_9PSED|nr:hypothetical protein [Pseudomonas kitaguniensis]MPR05348.1 hypothetical protein [Pseudomonas kitaguniensis]